MTDSKKKVIRQALSSSCRLDKLRRKVTCCSIIQFKLHSWRRTAGDQI